MNLSFRYIVLLITFCFFSSVSMARISDPLADLFADEPEFLQVDEAFQFDFIQKGEQVTLNWKIADGYYLYKKQFKTVVKQAELGMPFFPVAEQVEDEFFGLSDIFRGQLDITYPILSSVQDGIVKVRYQGCADAGLCYPPTIKEVYLNKVKTEHLSYDEAFVFDFKQTSTGFSLNWKIADGYYLHQDQLSVTSSGSKLDALVFPITDEVDDPYFGISKVFRNNLALQYSITEFPVNKKIDIVFQGCNDKGLCYQPIVKTLELQSLTVNTEPKGDANSVNIPEPLAAELSTKTPISEQFELASLLSSEQSLLITLLLFLGLGIGLAFTPCVFPMYPILSGIVIGQGKTISTSRAFSLSFVYVQGMAITYSLLGLIVASAGVQFQAGLQHPAILIALIVIFVLLAVVMFGAYELQLPSSWQEKLNAMSNKQTSGSYLGVLAMGAISGLVASPCTTAPLTGILLFIAQSGDLVLGFSALYVLSLGMGIPLILFGITGGKLLPKAGNWMNVVKVTFGFMMLAVATMFLERLVTHVATDIAWTFLGLTTFTYFYVMNQNSQTSFYKGLRALLIFIGLFVSAGYGYQIIVNETFAADRAHTAPSSDNSHVVPSYDFGSEIEILRKKLAASPELEAMLTFQITFLERMSNGRVDNSTLNTHTEFMKITNLREFQTELARANTNGKTVMVDLYADWCVACKEFEKYTFPDKNVIKALNNSVLMQIDLTDSSDSNLEFQEHFSVLGLPTIMFFDLQGQEVDSARVAGFMRAEPFAKHVNSLFSK